MSVEEVADRYTTRRTELQEGIVSAHSHRRMSLKVLVGAAALFMILGVYALEGRVSAGWPLSALATGLVATRFYVKHGRAGTRSWRIKRFYDRAMKRMQADWAGTGQRGEAFIDPAHPYATELNLFGEGSLFELLCTTRSAVGQGALASYLLRPAALDDIHERQDAIRELTGKPTLREELALLGRFEFSEARGETFAGWLRTPSVPFERWLSPALLITSLLLAVIFLPAVIVMRQSIPWLAPLLLFNSVIGLAYRDRISTMMDSVRDLSAEILIVREGLQLLVGQEFQSAKLRRLAACARNAPEPLRKLERLIRVLNESYRDIWYYLPSRILMLGTQLFMAIEQWRMANRSSLRQWLEAWAEFEALSALACYAYENPDNRFPEVSGMPAHFKALALGHPLLPDHACVRNDVDLDRACRLLIISGSNMAGKSTVLRAIGLNAILALAGAPVRADALCISELSICASIALVDSLLNGKSKFLSEVDKLRQAIGMAANGPPVLFLVDEIFSGTNSRDRRVAAEAVVRTLIDRGSIGALSTHDLALTEMVEDGALHGVNVHMSSSGLGDTMDFDYLLKPGVTRETNALAIARMAGVPV